MYTVPENIVIEAARTIDKYDLKAKEALCDRIHEVQPNIFFATIGLTHFGVSHAKLEHVIHMLMVVHTAFEREPSITTRLISIDDVEFAYKKFCEMLKYLKSEPDKNIWKLTTLSYPQRALLVYIFAYMDIKGIAIRTDEDACVFAMMKVIVDTYHRATNPK